MRLVSLVTVLVTFGLPAAAAAQSALSGERIAIARAAGRIVIDGNLDDEGWRNATKIEKWYEINPGDNTEPGVKNVGYLTYDEHFFYAGFEFEDPNPNAIRAPYADRDNIGNGYNDYGGVIIDSRNSGRTATFFVVTPRNIQYDSVTDDASGEDSAPDFFWDSATRIKDRGWTLEIRIPFSSLRYRNVDPQTWGILLYRNYPRDRHFQFFSAKIPRNSNCFICRSNPLTGLERLPGGGHLVAAPYLAASEAAHPREDLGSPLVSEPVKPHAGLDVKYTANADNAIDFTLNPDFSQVESDTAQISANERFALFFPEKRPFFLEGADLFQTPIQAVYTRTITDPNYGGRLTGKALGMRYTVLLTDDSGGGSVILPGPNGSDLATVDFGSTNLIARVKREMGLSFVGMLVTARDAHKSDDPTHSGVDNGSNRVVGPDFQWRPNGSDAVTGQWLYSVSHTPARPDLAEEWTGQDLIGHGAHVRWEHNSTHADWFGFYQDFSDGFRADNGFVPQVGYRQGFGGGGWTVRPKGFVSRQRTFVNADYQYDRSGALISRVVMPGTGMDIRWDGFLQFRYHDEQTRAGDQVLGRKRFGYVAQFSPSRWLSQISVDGLTGQEIDFDNVRPGRGSTINFNARINPTQHVELAVLENVRWLDVDKPAGGEGRLFTARVSRIRGTYNFTSRFFVRGIAQYVTTDRDPSLYTTETTARSAEFSGSVLLSYKLNWQSVVFVGYGDTHALTDQEVLAPSDRQFFVKLSYAFQR
jgi:hypothetical protein